jgi:hypothetical protein
MVNELGAFRSHGCPGRQPEYNHEAIEQKQSDDVIQVL